MFKKKKDKNAPAPEAEEAEVKQEGVEEGAEEGGKKKPPLKLILIAAAGALVVLGGGGGAAWWFLIGSKPPAEGEHGAEAGHKAELKKKEAKGGHGGGAAGEGNVAVAEGPDGVYFYTVPDLVVNIQANEGRPTFLKLKLAFELSDPAVADAIVPNAPRLTDMFQTFLRELRPEDLSGSQGSYQLRMEILRRVNLVIAPAKIDSVLIQEMLVQ
jgi:flagellar FliL protein